MSAPWWAEAVIYHVYLRSFQDTDGDGVGDIPGLRARLPYLRWLGVDAVLVSPFYRSPMVDFGYDVADHTAVDPRYGTLADFDGLVDDAHGLGIRVLVDLVPSHTSNRHPWFEESRLSRGSARRDWYLWRDGSPSGGPPNNWTSVFGGSAWTCDGRTAQWYLHSFLPEIPDLDWRNPAVEEAIFDVVRFWLDRGVEGFRVDAADHLFKDPGLQHDPPNPGFDGPSSSYRSQVRVHDRGHPDVHPVLRRLRRLVDRDPARPGVLLAEVVTHLTPEKLTHWATYFGTRLDEVHLPINLSLPRLQWSAEAFGAAIDAVEAAVPAGGWPTVVFGSHDEHRVASRHGPEAARCCLVLLLTLRGTPVLYYGDELLMPDAPVPPEGPLDPLAVTHPDRNRDLGRGPMPWDGRPHAGFTASRDGPWLPLPPTAGDRSVAHQQADLHSPLQLTRRLLALRRRCRPLRRGRYRRLDPNRPGVLAFEREDGGQAVATVVKFRPEPVTLDRWPPASRLLVASWPSTAMSVDGRLALPGTSAAVVALGAR